MNYMPRHEQGRTEEQKSSMQLSVQDAWLSQLAPVLFASPAAFQVLNESLNSANQRISSHGTVSDLRIQESRERVFTLLGFLDEDNDFYNALQDARKNASGTYPPPSTFIENARLLYRFNCDLVTLFSRKGRNLFRQHIRPLAREDTWREHVFIDVKDVSSHMLPEATKGLARVLDVQHLIVPLMAELPTIAADDPRRQVVMARIALEFFDTKELQEPAAIGRFLRLSPEAALLVGIKEKKKANIAAVEDFIHETSSKPAQMPKTQRQSQVTERRREFRRAISEEPLQLLDALGTAALHSYLVYAPPLQPNTQYLVGDIFYELKRAHEKPKIDKQHLPWIQRLVGEGVELGNAWLRGMAYLMLLGSKKATPANKQRELVLAARNLFYARLKLADAGIRKSKAYPRPTHFIKVADTLQARGITNIDELVCKSFRIFIDGVRPLNVKIDAVLAQGYEVTTPEVQALLPHILYRDLKVIEEKLLPYRPGMSSSEVFTVKITKTQARQDNKSKTPRRQHAEEVEEPQPAEMTLEVWRRARRLIEQPKVLSKDVLNLASEIALFLDSEQSPALLAEMLSLERLTPAQLNELARFIEAYEHELNTKVIRDKISTLEF